MSKPYISKVIIIFCILLIAIIINFTFDTQTTLPAPTLTTGPLIYSGLDELLQNIALVRFDEKERFSEGRQDSRVLRNIKALYMPHDAPEAFPLSQIVIGTFGNDDTISFYYRLPGFYAVTGPRHETAGLVWHRNRPSNDVSLRGGRPGVPGMTHVYYRWSQHGYEFEAHILERFPEEEAYDIVNVLLNPMPLNAWEIHGNSVSLSFQGLSNLAIFKEDGNELISTITGPPLLLGVNRPSLEHHNLYVSASGGITRIGYSWLTGEETSRRQFVLQPGTYTFKIDGIVGEPQLVIRHFYNREVVSSVDFTEYLASQDFTSFTVTVTPDNTGSGDTVVINP